MLRAISGAVDVGGLVGTERVEVGGRSMVGYATARAEARIAQRIEADSEFFAYPGLPRTRSEAVLPMLVGEDAIGALDVQSDRAEDFPEDAVTILKTMAYQIAIAVQNARLHSAEKERSRELGEAYKALRENQARTLIAEKMASLGRLTAGIAHEMNTLLAALRASLMEIGRLADEYRSSIGDARVTARGPRRDRRRYEGLDQARQYGRRARRQFRPGHQDPDSQHGTGRHRAIRPGPRHRGGAAPPQPCPAQGELRYQLRTPSRPGGARRLSRRLPRS